MEGVLAGGLEPHLDAISLNAGRGVGDKGSSPEEDAGDGDGDLRWTHLMGRGSPTSLREGFEHNIGKNVFF